MNYQEFLHSKIIKNDPSGFDVDESVLPVNLYDYQKDLVRWACKRGKSALFTMTGTGKTAMQVSWADQVAHQGHSMLILAPLAVSKQTVREAMKFGITVHPCRTQSDVVAGINIANYEMLHHFDPASFGGIGSTGYVALKEGRKSLMSELKESYFKQNILNCAAALSASHGDLFMEAA